MKFFSSINIAKIGSLVCILGFQFLHAQHPDILKTADGNIQRTADSLGNKIPDFSYAGYEASEKSIPTVAVKVYVPQMDEDATETIQKAIDYVGQLKPDANGFKGAVLLAPGTFRVEKTIYLNTSGVVLRGSGTQENATVLLGTGISRKPVIHIQGNAAVQYADTLKIQENYVPLGAMQLKLDKTDKLSVHQEIAIVRPMTKEWIKSLQMDFFGGETGWIGWKEGDWNSTWNRTITNISGNVITFDAPLTMALNKEDVSAFILLISNHRKINHVGVENLKMDSSFDINNPKDEQHRWQAITLENVQNAWVRQLHFQHFAGGAVGVLATAQKVTVEDCLATNPVSEIAAFRRQTFYTEGQQTLFQRCYSEFGYNDFAVGGYGTTGPNVFVQCESHLPYSNSGAIGSWATGVLFDVVYIDGEALSYNNREQAGRGAGWTAANSVIWETSASKINCYSPPTAQNWAFGVWGQFGGNGHWKDVNSHIRPRSLFYALLENRLDSLPTKSYLKSIGNEPSSSPTLAQAEELTEEANFNLKTLQEWIVEVSKENKLPTAFNDALLVSQIKTPSHHKKSKEEPKSIHLSNGKLLFGNALLTGKTFKIMWWRGSLRADDVQKATPHITRFVPGRYGKGFTDDVSQTVAALQNDHIAALDHNYGLWYDRRMDDHERVRRIDADVWPPLYEQPFARSGEGLAWDHLSKYDLTSYNEWYWNRMATYATTAAPVGQVLLHQMYFQHNILEAGAHWASSPWRSANNINHTDFPEPPPYAGDKRIFMDEQFYDVTNIQRKEIHQKFIEHALDVFQENENVIQFTSEEYTGPLAFMQFWVDVIKQWKATHQSQQLIALSATKDVQDAILQDSQRSDVIDVIDIKYWHYKEDGTVYAPEGGVHLAPRQHARKMKTGKETEEQVYRAVKEYKEKYPSKAVLYNTNAAPRFGWAVLMAGGSLPNIPEIQVPSFWEELATMKPVTANGVWMMENEKGSRIYYFQNRENITVDLSDEKGKFEVYFINPDTGKTTKQQTIRAGKSVEFTAVEKVIFIKKK